MQKNSGEHRAKYEIKPEERQLMIEAGVTYYFKEKERYGEGWDPELVFGSKEFQRLPEDVQREIRKEVRKKEENKKESSPSPISETTLPSEVPETFRKAEVAEVRPEPKPLERPEREEHPAALQARELFKKGVATKAGLTKIVELFLSANRQKEAYDILQEIKASARYPKLKRQWIEALETRIVKVEKVPPPALSKNEEEKEEEAEVIPLQLNKIAEIIRAAGIDPDRSREEIIPLFVKQLSDEFHALSQRLKRMKLEESTSYLREGWLEESFATIDVERLEDLRDRLVLSPVESRSTAEHPERSKWIQYLDRILPDLKFLEQHRQVLVERLREQIEVRRLKLLREDKSLSRPSSVINNEKEIWERLIQDGVDIERSEETGYMETEIVQRPLEEVIKLLDKNLKEFKNSIAQMRKRIKTASLEDCARMLAGAEWQWEYATTTDGTLLVPSGTISVEHTIGDLAQLRAKYNRFNYADIHDLAGYLKNAKAGPELLPEVLEYWKNYVQAVRDKIEKMGDVIDREIDYLKEDIRQKQGELIRLEQEKRWEQEGLPAAVQYQVEWIENELAEQFPAGAIPESLRARYAFNRALEDSERNLKYVLENNGDLSPAQVVELWRQVINRLMPKLAEPYTQDEIEQARQEISGKKIAKSKEDTIHEFREYITALRKIPELRARERHIEDPEKMKEELGKFFDYLTKVPVPLEVIMMGEEGKKVMELRVSYRWLPRELSVFVENPKGYDVSDFDPRRNRGVIKLKRLVVDPKRRSKLVVSELVGEYENFDGARAFEQGVREALKDHFAKKAGVSPDEVSCPPHILATYLGDYAHQLLEFVEWSKVRPRKRRV